MAKRVLVIGSTGLVGSHLMEILGYLPDIDLCGTYYKEKVLGLFKLELENPSSISAMFKQYHPDVVYVPAFVSNVDRCEVDGYTRRINVGGIFDLVDIANEFKSKVIFFSSAYVFDGIKNSPYDVYDTPMPIQQYGIQKLQCENKVLSTNPNNLVIRTSNVIGKELSKKNFGYQVIKALSGGGEFYAYDDQLVSPIHAYDLASRTVELVDGGFKGLFHINGEDEVTKYEFARDIAHLFGFDGKKVLPMTAETSPRPAKRPYNACLKNTISPYVDYDEMLGRFYDEN